MEIVKDIVLVLHFIGLASVIGGFLVQTRSSSKVIHPAMLHGALTQLVTGLILVGLNEAMDHEVDNAKIGVKLVVTLVVAALAWRYRSRRSVAPGIWAAVGGLSILNVIVAVFW